MSYETIRQTLLMMGVRWKRAKKWITSPDPDYARKKRQRDRLLLMATQQDSWVLGFQDEVWWSRLAQPQMHAWCEDEPLKLAWIIHDSTPKTPEPFSQKGIQRFHAFDSVFLYTNSETQSLEGLGLCPKFW